MTLKNHPRYESLLLREKIKNAYLAGYLADTGMIAHGRGEAFDYLIGEKTTQSGKTAIDAAAISLILAKNPVLSVNGNTTALVPEEIIKLANLLDAEIEINLFYRTAERVKLIEKIYKNAGAKEVLGTDDDDLKYIDDIESPRATASSKGTYIADVILVPLEDGDRTEILVNSGLKVITIDLNPLSRTAQKADITIVDNIVRAVPAICERVEFYKNYNEEDLRKELANFNNKENLKKALKHINERLNE